MASIAKNNEYYYYSNGFIRFPDVISCEITSECGIMPLFIAEDNTLPAIAKMILFLIMNNKKGRSISLKALKSIFSEKQVRTSTEILEEQGYLLRAKVRDKNTGFFIGSILLATWNPFQFNITEAEYITGKDGLYSIQLPLPIQEKIHGLNFNQSESDCSPEALFSKNKKTLEKADGLNFNQSESDCSPEALLPYSGERARGDCRLTDGIKKNQSKANNLSSFSDNSISLEDKKNKNLGDIYINNNNIKKIKEKEKNRADMEFSGDKKPAESCYKFTRMDKTSQNSNKSNQIKIHSRNLAKTLGAIVELRCPWKKITETMINSWGKVISTMIVRDFNGSYSVEECVELIRDRLEWYESNFDKQCAPVFAPVIESANALREKFGKLSAAMDRERQESPKVNTVGSRNSKIGKKEDERLGKYSKALMSRKTTKENKENGENYDE